MQKVLTELLACTCESMSFNQALFKGLKMLLHCRFEQHRTQCTCKPAQHCPKR